MLSFHSKCPILGTKPFFKSFYFLRVDGVPLFLENLPSSFLRGRGNDEVGEKEGVKGKGKKGKKKECKGRAKGGKEV